MMDPLFGSLGGVPQWTGSSFPGSLLPQQAPSAPAGMPLSIPGPIMAGPLPTPVSWNYGVPPGLSILPGGDPIATLLMAVALRRGQPQGPTKDKEVEEFVYDALDLLPGTEEIEARCEAGRVTLTGSVAHKRIKHDVGEICWAIPAVTDVQNTVTIALRRRPRAGAPQEQAAPAATGQQQR